MFLPSALSLHGETIQPLVLLESFPSSQNLVLVQAMLSLAPWVTDAAHSAVSQCAAVYFQ